MARTTKGSLYKRGKNYWLCYSINKKRTRLALKDETGKPVTTESLAKKAADKILSVITTKDEMQRLRLLQSELENSEEKAARAERNLKNARVTISAGWTIFMQCPNRPECCKRFPVDELPPHSTPSNYASHYRQFADWVKINHANIVLLSDVAPAIASDYAAYLDKQKVASGTFNKHIGFLKLLFSVLIENEELHCANPFLRLQRRTGIVNSRDVLTKEQIGKLINSAEGELKILFALGYFTGLRLGDCCTLLWREISLERGVIERIPRKTQNTRKDRNEALVKIGMHPFLLNLLSAGLVESGQDYVLPHFAELYLSERDNAITRMITRHFKCNDIQTIRPGTGKGTGKRAIVDIGFHSLRYSYISHNAEAGTPAAVIQKNAGHANPAMTEHYTRISDQAAIQYASVLPCPAEIIDAEVLEIQNPDEDAERDMIRQYADSLRAYP